MLGFIKRYRDFRTSRVKQQTKSAKNIVKYLKQNSKIDKDLLSNRFKFWTKKITKKQMIDGGSIISFELNSFKRKRKKFSFFIFK